MVGETLALLLLLPVPLIAFDMQEAKLTNTLAPVTQTTHSPNTLDAYVADMFCILCRYEPWPSCSDENCAIRSIVDLYDKRKTNNFIETINGMNTHPGNHANKRLQWNTRNRVSLPILSGRKPAEGMIVKGFAGSQGFSRLSAGMTNAGVKGRRIFRSRPKTAHNAYSSVFKDKWFFGSGAIGNTNSIGF